MTAADAPSPSEHSLAGPALTALPSDGLTGSLKVPGDKSISHRALMFGALAVGETKIEGLLEGEDVLRTAAAMRALGAEVIHEGPGRWRVFGRGIGGFGEPDDVLDFGNAGTGARLALGVLAGQPITAFLTGDASLRRRPMGRVMAPLERMGVRFVSREGGRLPLAVTGPETLLPIEYRLPVPSAQVKSAVLLAGLSAPGETVVIEPEPTRDHSERLLQHFGASVAVTDLEDGRRVVLTGQPELQAAPVMVPADPSSAAFPAVAALLLPSSELRLEGVCLNPLRDGVFRTLLEMGADITEENRRVEAGEPVADLRIKSSRLRGIEVPAERAPSMIDEYPILAMAAACAQGRTVMRGLAELRVKESDRLSGVARGLAACGVVVEEGEDSLIVEGCGGRPRGGATIAAELDHRIAMSFLVLGLASEQPVTIDDAAPIATSFPGFPELMRGLGARLS
ncbi:3-phosphoshikimate 1-carboxyvinyltransferase [Aquibaculum sediminis]|uniref:3-phosphoshikimate 1-carboxyvinyltransferase n=1 Tax=Aquibaculum sediminis TaxID=3231907 RepID=UPI003F5E3A41